MRCPAWCDRILWKVNQPLYSPEEDIENDSVEVVYYLLFIILKIDLN